MNLGDIVHLNWTPNAGNEMATKHYGVVLSCYEFNELIPRIGVAPITSKSHIEFASIRVPLETANKKFNGFICLDHIRSIDPLARNMALVDDKITHACKMQCRHILKKIFTLSA